VSATDRWIFLPVQEAVASVDRSRIDESSARSTAEGEIDDALGRQALTSTSAIR
jgi:hypothetical protein